MLLSDAKAVLSHAVDTGRLAHAYMVVGSPRGGAAELAIHVMQKLSCKEENAPCGECDVCRQIAARTWCDSLWVHPMKKSRIISIDQMRAGSGNKIPPPYLLDWLSETSFSGGWKMAVLVAADCMNQAAENAFLKTLEEPPPKTIIFLLTDSPQKLLPTTRSRCQRIDITEAAAELSEPHRSEVLRLLATPRPAGSLSATALATQILSTLSSIKKSVEGEVKAEVNTDTAGLDVDDDELEARVSSRYKEYQLLLFKLLNGWFRDIMSLVAGGDDSALNYPEYAAQLHARASRITLAHAMSNIDCIDSAMRQIERNIPEATILSYWFDRMIF